MTLPWIINSRCFIILLVDTINAHNAPCLNLTHNFIELENDLEEKIHTFLDTSYKMEMFYQVLHDML